MWDIAQKIIGLFTLIRARFQGFLLFYKALSFFVHSGFALSVDSEDKASLFLLSSSTVQLIIDHQFAFIDSVR